MRTKSDRLGRHLRWAVPLAAAPVIYVVAMLVATRIMHGVDVKTLGAGWDLLVPLVFLVAVVCPVIALVYATAGGAKAFRHWRRAHGHYTKKEAAAARQASASADGWGHARFLQSTLSRRVVPETIRIWDVVANPGEAFFLDVPAHYARHYGMDVPYSRTSGFYFGRPAFVLAALSIGAASNAARRNAAARQAAAQWREHQPCRLVVSNQRLLCQVGGTWLSFHFSAVTAVYPEVGEWSLITQFDSTSPLLLSGVHVPAAAVLAVLATQGPEAVVVPIRACKGWAAARWAGLPDCTARRRAAAATVCRKTDHAHRVDFTSI